MTHWVDQLHYDPMKVFVEVDDKTISYFVHGDFLDAGDFIQIMQRVLSLHP